MQKNIFWRNFLLYFIIQPDDFFTITFDVSDILLDFQPIKIKSKVFVYWISLCCGFQKSFLQLKQPSSFDFRNSCIQHQAAATASRPGKNIFKMTWYSTQRIVFLSSIEYKIICILISTSVYINTTWCYFILYFEYFFTVL